MKDAEMKARKTARGIHDKMGEKMRQKLSLQEMEDAAVSALPHAAETWTNIADYENVKESRWYTQWCTHAVYRYVLDRLHQEA